MKKYKEKDLASRLENANDINIMLQNAQEAEWDQREIARECMIFITKRDGMWEPFWWSNNMGKPRYSFDMTSPIVDQVMAGIERSSFDIRVSPAGGGSTKETALVYDGLIRTIENISGARNIYQYSARNMGVMGFDAWRIVHDYADKDSFEQDLMLEWIPNAIDRVWFDPAAQKQDRSDAEWCVVLHAVSKSEYDKRWPKGSGMSVSEGRDANAYYEKAEVVIIGELLYYKSEERELVLMNNGAVYEVDDKFKAVSDELAALGITELRRRKSDKRKVCSRMFDGLDWLDESVETVFDQLPVIPVYGNFKLFEDKTLYSGIVEKLLDPQRVLNYSVSREIEEGALAPRAKYWMTQKQAAGHERKLSSLNTNSDPVQFFNPDPEFPGVPQQQGGAQINPGLRNISETMRQMIGQTAGMFAANMGDNPGLQSGIAIENLQTRGDNGVLKYIESLQFAIAYTGKLLVKAIPKVYDTRRQVRLMYEDGSTEMQMLNDPVIDEQTGQIVVLNDLSKGTYDVTCRAGPSFRNQQQETLHAMMEVAKVDPSILQIGGDLFLKSISTPVSEQLAARKRAQMVKMGVIPMSEMTDEEKAEIQQAQQGQQDPNMVLAQAEMQKAQADLLDAQTKQLQAQIDMFNAETNRMKAMVEAQEKGVRIQDIQATTTGKQLDNVRKGQELMAPVMFRQ